MAASGIAVEATYRRKSATLSLLGWSAAWVYCLMLFRAYPELDLLASRLFFLEVPCPGDKAARIACGFFPLRQSLPLEYLRTILFYAPFVAVPVVLWKIVDAFSHHGATYDGRRVEACGAALLAFLVGPGLIVNGVLKAFSHRPRPFETDLFGGEWMFRVAGDFGGQCLSNCSFISGEAAGAGWLFCLLMLVPPGRHAIACRIVAAGCGVCVFLRLAFGGHYLSDVLLGFLSSPVIFYGILAALEQRSPLHSAPSGTVR